MRSRMRRRINQNIMAKAQRFVLRFISCLSFAYYRAGATGATCPRPRQSQAHRERLSVKSHKLLVKDLRTQARRHARFGVLAVSLISLAMPSFSHRNGGATPSGASRPANAQSSDRIITPIPFGEMNGADVYNASGVIPLADSRFLFCDNKTGDAFFELDLTTDGRMKGPLIRRPLQGVAAGDVRDLEGMTLAEED